MHMLQSKISIAVPVLLVAAYYFWSFISHTQQSTDPYIKVISPMSHPFFHFMIDVLHQIYVYMNGQWADPVAVDIPRAICGSVRPRCVADIVCDAVGISGECTVCTDFHKLLSILFIYCIRCTLNRVWS